MSGVGLLAVSMLAALAGSELVLRGTKLQTGLARVLCVWAAVYLGALYWLFTGGRLSPFAFSIFWGGAFLSWFGVRSHVESSILLRMLVMLRQRGMSEEQLVAEYTSRHGEVARIEELCRGGLAQRQTEGAALCVTEKGASILRLVAKLR
jgi:hypothetical protein